MLTNLIRKAAHLTFVTTIAFAAPSVSDAEPAAAGFTLKDQPGEYLDVLRGGKITGRYMYAYDTSKLGLTYKPYLHVFDAEGQAPITKGPGGEFTHHRGIFIGWKDIIVEGKTYDRWHMKGGEQIHQKFISQKADAKGATITSHVDWMDEASHPIIEEMRSMSFLPPPAPAYAFIDVTSKLKAMLGDTRLEGDPEHSGLQFRPANEVNRLETTYVFPKENADPKKDRDYPWLGETFTLKDKRYSVIYLNHPSNPKGTVFSAYRNYGRFGGYFKTAIPKGGEAVIHCAFLVAEGDMPAADWIQKQYNTFAGASDPVPKISVQKVEAPKAKAAPASEPPAK